MVLFSLSFMSGILNLRSLPLCMERQITDVCTLQEKWEFCDKMVKGRSSVLNRLCFLNINIIKYKLNQL